MNTNIKPPARKMAYGLPKLRRLQPSFLCSGCGHGLIQKAVLETIEDLKIEDKTVAVIGVGCSGIPYVAPDATNLDTGLCSHGTSPAVAIGIKKAHFGDVIVFTIQGDGDASAIGGGCLLNSAARGDNITVIMCNNAIYGTTGGQLAPTTLMDQVTTTTPEGRFTQHGYPLHVAELLSNIKGVTYSARGSVSTPANFKKTKSYMKAAFKVQMEEKGFSYVEVLSPCPTNWHMGPLKALDWVDNVMVKEFPLGVFKSLTENE